MPAWPSPAPVRAPRQGPQQESPREGAGTVLGRGHPGWGARLCTPPHRLCLRHQGPCDICVTQGRALGIPVSSLSLTPVTRPIPMRHPPREELPRTKDPAPACSSGPQRIPFILQEAGGSSTRPPKALPQGTMGGLKPAMQMASFVLPGVTEAPGAAGGSIRVSSQPPPPLLTFALGPLCGPKREKTRGGGGGKAREGGERWWRGAEKRDGGGEGQRQTDTASRRLPGAGSPGLGEGDRTLHHEQLPFVWVPTGQGKWQLHPVPPDTCGIRHVPSPRGVAAGPTHRSRAPRAHLWSILGSGLAPEARV